jgi:hypothetical protein
MGTGEWGQGDKEDKGDKGAGGEIFLVSYFLPFPLSPSTKLPNALFPIQNLKSKIQNRYECYS